jgi:DNA repair ATPase RecN
MKGESLLQILQVIYDMFIELMKHIDKPQLPSAYSKGFKSVRDETKTSNQIPDDSLSPEQKYANLEKLMQKYEAEIRDHIRVEQQLKIYVENLQEAWSEKEKELKNSLEAKIKSMNVKH